MATKQFLTLEGLSTYDGLIKQYIGTEDAKSIKSISVSGNTVSFFKTADGSGTAAYTVDLPDVSGFMDKIADAEGGKILISNANGEAVETGWGILDDEHEQGFVTGYISPNEVGFNGMIPTWSEDMRCLVNSSVDIDDVLTKIANAEGDKILISHSDGTIVESDVSLDDKMDIIDDADGGKVVVSAQDGSVVESNLEVSDIATTTELEGKIDVIFGATGGKIATTTATGQVTESNTAISDLATQTDLGGKMDKIADADGDKVLMSNANGEAVEGLPLASSDTSGIITGYFIDGAREGDVMIYDSGTDSIRTDGVNISDLATQTDIEGLENSKLDKLEDPSGDCVVMSNSDGTISEGFGIADSSHSGIITGYFLDGASQDDIMVYDGGQIRTSSVNISDLATQSDITELQEDIGDVETELNTLETLVGTIPQGSSATNVVGYVDEQIDELDSDAEVTLVEAQTPTTGYLKTYELYQGGNTATNLIGKIDIPKDLVVTSGEIVVNPTGQPAGTYLKLVIANQTEPVYINVADLCDVYTAAASAAQVQLAISSTNEISATLVAGGVGTTELATSAVTTQKIADDAVTADKVAITAHTEAQTAGADGVAISVTTTDGQVSAVSASIASNTYDAYGAASTVQSTVIGSAGDAASANTINGAKAYADAATAAIATADIEALFE